MAARISAVIVIVLFAWFLFIALSNILQLAESRRLYFGDFALLLFCAIVCAGSIGFFYAFCGRPSERQGSLFGTQIFHSRPIRYRGHKSISSPPCETSNQSTASAVAFVVRLPHQHAQFVGIVDNAPDEATAIARAIVESDVPLNEHGRLIAKRRRD